MVPVLQGEGNINNNNSKVLREKRMAAGTNSSGKSLAKEGER